MNWHAQIRQRLLAHHSAPDEDVVEELAQHAAALFEACRAEGATPADAERRVLDEIAESCDATARYPRRPRRAAAIDPPAAVSAPFAGLAQDVRYSLRLLRRQPGFAAVALLTLALGIGAPTTLFSVTYGVLLRPLPWPDADRLVRLVETRDGGVSPFGAIVTNGSYYAWRDRASTIDALGAWTTRTMTIGGDGGAVERVPVTGVTASLLPMLGAQAALGTTFGDADERAGTSALLSHGFWRARFGGARDAVGRVIQLDGRPYTVAGVMPTGFAFPDRATRVWIPYHPPPVENSTSERESVSMFEALARLRPGGTASQASQEATARARAIPDLSPMMIKVMGGGGPTRITAVPLLEDMTRQIKPALLLFLAAVGLLFATAVANVASLQLARVTARRQEVAIRTAVGADAARLARQLLVENSIFGVGGGAAGLGVAWLLHRAVPLLLPADFPRLSDIAFDAPVLAIAALLAVTASVAIGLLPLSYTRRLNLVDALNENSLAPVGVGRRSRVARTRAAIMTGQVAVAALLLLVAALLGRSFVELLRADQGYDPANVLTARVLITDRTMTPARRTEVLEDILTRVRALPGATQAAFTSILPLTPRESSLAFRMAPRGGANAEGDLVQASLRMVSPGYFAAMGMRVREGRPFTLDDTLASLPVVVVNRTFARRYLGDRAVGVDLPATLDRGRKDRPAWRVVGVIDDARQMGVQEAARPEIFATSRQQSAGLAADQFLVLRMGDDPREAALEVQRIVRQADPSAVIESIVPMETRLMDSLARPRLYAFLLGSFAVFALTIAAVGLFGVLSYSMAQRTRELGVRTALGARPSDILRLVVGEGLAMTLGGLAAGIIAAGWLAQSLARFLYGITPQDPISYLAVAVALIVAALAGCAVPALRAARLDPVKALRS